VNALTMEMTSVTWSAERELIDAVAFASDPDGVVEVGRGFTLLCARIGPPGTSPTWRPSRQSRAPSLRNWRRRRSKPG
jgi:hypothetical protein